MESFSLTKKDILFFGASFVAAIMGIAAPEIINAIRDGIYSASLVVSKVRAKNEAEKQNINEKINELDIKKKELDSKEKTLHQLQKDIEASKKQATEQNRYAL
jgi:hypothetical protein